MESLITVAIFPPAFPVEAMSDKAGVERNDRSGKNNLKKGV
jgi:hypothetical protein